MDLTLLLTSRGNEWYELGSRSTDAGGVPTHDGGITRRRFTASSRADLTMPSSSVWPAARRCWRRSRPRKSSISRSCFWVEIWQHPATLAHRLSRPVVRVLYRSADAVVAFGPHVSEFISRESGRTTGIFIAPQAADSEPFRKAFLTTRIDAMPAATPPR